MVDIAFDEAGNTGSNLLDKNQKIYALASVNFTDKETDILTNIFTHRGDELHFKQLRKNYDQQIITFLNHDLINKSKVKYAVSDKRFDLICRLVDYIMEPVWYNVGVDLYKDGKHMATANMLYISSITYGYENKFDQMLILFQRMVRAKSPQAIEDFYSHVSNIKIGLFDNVLFDIILDSKSIINDILEDFHKYTIDPAYPAVISLANLWHYELDSPFNIIHDNSKQVEFWKDMLQFFSDPTRIEKTEVLIINNKKATYPLQIESISLVDSKDSKQVQLADLIASSLSYMNNKIASGQKDEFVEQIFGSNLVKCTDGGFNFPSQNVTPESLGMVGFSNQSLDFLYSVLSKNENYPNPTN